MVRIHPIDTFDRPELQPYRTMRYQHEHRKQGIFVAEGEKVVRRLIESSLGIVSVMVPEKWVKEYQGLLAHRPEDIDLFVGPKELLETLIGFSMYQGLLAVGLVPPRRELESVLRDRSRPILLAATEGMSNALNMGSLVRNCAAFGADALLASETCCSPFMRRAVRASMGTVFRMPVVELSERTPLITALRALQSHGIRIIAAHPHADGRTVAQADFKGNCCIVLGSEGEGLSAATLELCDDHAAIPMPPDVDSLNVASASAAFLYEAARQRGAMGRSTTTG